MQFQELKEYIDALNPDIVPGCEIIVAQNHQRLFHYTHGFADFNRQKPVSENNLYFLYSATKIFTCTAGAQLLERGLLRLEDPVQKYLPEFGELYVNNGDTLRPAQTVLTVRHLFTMCGGYTYDLGNEHIVALQKQTNNRAPTRQMLRAIAKMPLVFDPGAAFRYSLCHDILAGIIEVISGLTFGEYLKQNIFAPLGITEMGFRPTPEVLSRMSAQYLYNFNLKKAEPTTLTNPFALSNNYESGGAGLIGGARDYILLADALACGGVGKTGNRILNPQTVNLLRQNHLTPAQFKTFCKPNTGYSYGLGVRTKIKQQSNNCYSPLGEFGWDGAAGAYIMIDPENALSIFYVQHVRNNPEIYDTVHPMLRDLTYKALGKEQEHYEKD